MKALILTVTAGEGHNSVAKSLKKQYEDMGIEVMVIDVFKEYASKFKCFMLDDAYRLACKYALSTYNFIYRMLKRRDADKRDTTMAQNTIKKETPALLKAIYSYKPNMIICTHWLPAIALTNIRKCFNVDAVVSTILTDYGVHPFWESSIGVDYCFTPCEDVKENLLERGFKDEQIVCTGLPVRSEFYVEKDKSLMKDKLELDKNMFTVMLMTGGGGFGGIIKLFESLCKVNKPIQIIAINGRDQNSYNKIQKIIKKYPIHNFKNLGFVTNVDEYMTASDCIVGKCGGISVSESIAKLLPIITTNKLAEQELHNLQFLKSHSACFVLDKKNTPERIVNSILEFPATLDIMKENLKGIRRLNATQKIVEFMINKAEKKYGEVTFVPTMKDLKVRLKQSKKSRKSKKQAIECA